MLRFAWNGHRIHLRFYYAIGAAWPGGETGLRLLYMYYSWSATILWAATKRYNESGAMNVCVELSWHTFQLWVGPEQFHSQPMYLFVFNIIPCGVCVSTCVFMYVCRSTSVMVADCPNATTCCNKCRRIHMRNIDIYFKSINLLIRAVEFPIWMMPFEFCGRYKQMLTWKSVNLQWLGHKFRN